VADSLNNRFKALKQPPTEAVFSIDDDVHVSCKQMELAMEVWTTAPRAMVGFVPRLHSWDDAVRPKNSFRVLDTKASPIPGWRYHGALLDPIRYSVWWDGAYSMVLTKAAFFHRDYLAAYWRETEGLAELREYVDAHRNCEDIAMSMLVANITKAPPMWVAASMVDYGHTGGISGIGVQQVTEADGLAVFEMKKKYKPKKTNSHSESRTDCIAKFVDLLGHNPLRVSNVKYTDGRRTWFWS